jgi:hypothetical protein
MIFQRLESEDLVNCEAVCRQRRGILVAGTPWKRLFHRKVGCSPFWRKARNRISKHCEQISTETSAEKLFTSTETGPQGVPRNSRIQ